MTALYHLTTPLPEAERNARLYRGELIVFRGFDAVTEFTDRLRGHCIRCFGNDPTRIHRKMSNLDIDRANEALRAVVSKNSEVNIAWRQVLSSINTDLDETYGDSIVVRVQPPSSNEQGARTQPLEAHRDTWGSNLAAQINWWAPLYETTPERTLALFPGLFSQVVANNSADWNFEDMVQSYRTEGVGGYPLLPTATDPPNRNDALAISLMPGDLLCFSGAHLHASVPNTTELTRLSFETRTVNRRDMAAGLGAPDVDGAAPCVTPQIFRNLENGQKLGELFRR